MQKQLRTADNCKINYFVEGKNCKRKTYVLLHGFSGGSLAWLPVLRELKRCSVLIDLRGHGLSSRSKDKRFYKIERFIDDIEKVIQQEKLEKFTLVGHCFGGMLALEYAKRYPGKVEQLIMINAADRLPLLARILPKKDVIRKIAELIVNQLPNIGITGYENYEGLDYEKNISVRRIVNNIAFTHLHSYLAIFGSILTYDFSVGTERLYVPLIAISGARDRIIPRVLTENMCRRVPKAKYIMIDASHVAILTEPKLIAKIIVQG